MTTTTVTIDKVVNGGYGFSHLPSGQVILVRKALPEERLIVTPEETKKNYLFGKIKEIIKPHHARRKAPCPYYGQCGGCDLQHSDYDTQLTIKKSIVEDLLSRQSNVALQECRKIVSRPIPSPSEFHYRQRIRLQIDDDQNIGFNRFQSHTVIGIAGCLLADNEINKTLVFFKEHPESRHFLSLSTEVEIHLNPKTTKTVSIFKLKRKPRAADFRLAHQLCKDIDSLERVFFTGPGFAISGPYCQEEDNHLGNKFYQEHPEISKKLPQLSFSWEAGGFIQVNREQNLNLIETVLNVAAISTTDSVLDLYCGNGNFSIPLGIGAKSVLGIEGQGSAIRSAKHNAKQAGLTNTTFMKSPAHLAVNQLATEKRSFNTVVIDPPRLGAPDLAHDLAQITRKKLVYISCDPATLCRDLKALSGEGFSIKKIQPIDMFPQTHHIETVVLLEK